MEQVLHHTVLGFCWWDIPAFLILVGISAFLFIRQQKLKKREKDCEDELSRIYIDNSIES